MMLDDVEVKKTYGFWHKFHFFNKRLVFDLLSLIWLLVAFELCVSYASVVNIFVKTA